MLQMSKLKIKNSFVELGNFPNQFSLEVIPKMKL
jgi:hypothetical protein